MSVGYIHQRIFIDQVVNELYGLTLTERWLLVNCLKNLKLLLKLIKYIKHYTQNTIVPNGFIDVETATFLRYNKNIADTFDILIG